MTLADEKREEGRHAWERRRAYNVFMLLLVQRRKNMSSWGELISLNDTPPRRRCLWYYFATRACINATVACELLFFRILFILIFFQGNSLEIPRIFDHSLYIHIHSIWKHVYLELDINDAIQQLLGYSRNCNWYGPVILEVNLLFRIMIGKTRIIKL